MNFQIDNTYNLNDPDLSYFITNTQRDREIDNVGLIQSFLRDMKYEISTGDKRSDKSNFIKGLLQPQIGSGINFPPSRGKSPIYIFLPSDPDELVYQPKLIVLEKVGGSDNPMLSEQIVAIVEKLLEYQYITTNQHQNIVSAFTKKDQFVD